MYYHFLYLNCLSTGYARTFLLSIHDNPTYDDNRLWISWYQLLIEKYEPMIHIGIAKRNTFASAVSSDGEILMELLRFSYDADSF